MKYKPDFSILSSIYDFLGLVVFQGSLHKSQVHFLNSLAYRENALIVGGGTGKFLLDLLDTGSVGKVVYVDISPGMLKRAEKMVRKQGYSDRVEFICGSVDSIPNCRFDLICSHYFLDCFNETELKIVVDQLKALMTKNGIWHFTDFYLDQKSSSFRRSQVRFLYFFFKIVCGLKVDQLADFKEVFKEAGFKEVEEVFFRKRLLRTALYKI